jgi:hypothetical protein
MSLRPRHLLAALAAVGLVGCGVLVTVEPIPTTVYKPFSKAPAGKQITTPLDESTTTLPTTTTTTTIAVPELGVPTTLPGGQDQLVEQQVDALVPPGAPRICRAGASLALHGARAAAVGSDGKSWAPSLTVAQQRTVVNELRAMADSGREVITLLPPEPDHVRDVTTTRAAFDALTARLDQERADGDARDTFHQWAEANRNLIQAVLLELNDQCTGGVFVRFLTVWGS